MAKNKKSSQPLLQKPMKLNKPLIGILGAFILLLFLLYVVKFVQTSYQSKAGYYNRIKDSFSCRKKDDGEACQRLVCNGREVPVQTGGGGGAQEEFVVESESNGQQNSIVVNMARNAKCGYEQGICREKRCVALDKADKPDEPVGNGVDPFPGMMEPGPGAIGNWGDRACKGKEDGAQCEFGGNSCTVNPNGQEICMKNQATGTCSQGMCVPDRVMDAQGGSDIDLLY